MALATPDFAARRIRVRPFDAAHTAEWPLAALGAASIAMTFLEPDPTVTWDDARVAKVRAALNS